MDAKTIPRIETEGTKQYLELRQKALLFNKLNDTIGSPRCVLSFSTPDKGAYIVHMGCPQHLLSYRKLIPCFSYT